MMNTKVDETVKKVIHHVPLRQSLKKCFLFYFIFIFL